MTNPYITLTDSSGSGGKRFKAIEFRPPMTRGDTIEFTLGGKIDKQAGPVFNAFQYTLRIPIDTPEDSNYGSYEDFKRLYHLANSNLTPSDVISLTDHSGSGHNVYFVGDTSPTPLTTELEGVNAWFIVPVQLMEIP
jgi:hypothetical protein